MIDQWKHPTVDMYIVFKGNEYDIGSVINPHGLNKELIITATRK